MARPRSFRVAIVGGGMTGLTAALHLDRLGIDFILLEAHWDITPKVGASLALYPNFQRVLDQLGVLDEARAESSDLRRLTCRGLDGTVMFNHTIADKVRAETGGYGIAGFTRTQLLKILHRNLSEAGKKKILTGKRVERLEVLKGDEGVRVHLKGEDREFFEVDVVIGADGINSIVRLEMWRLAEEVDKNVKVFENDHAEDLETEFGCVFGLSHKTGDLERNDAYQISTQDASIGVFGGSSGEACWFLFFKVPVTKGKANIPKWDAFDDPKAVEICKQFSHVKLTDSTTFGDVYANCHRITTQACPNHCLRTWNYGRIICLGDAVAKTNPILAQGGAQGAESVLMLIDRLHAALVAQNTHVSADAEQVHYSPDDEAQVPRPSAARIEQILASVCAERQPRVQAFVNNSQQVIRISAWSGWLFRLVGKYVLPWLPTWVIVAQILGPWKGSYVSTSLPRPLIST